MQMFGNYLGQIWRLFELRIRLHATTVATTHKSLADTVVLPSMCTTNYV